MDEPGHKTSERPIQVTAAMIRREDGHFLIARRPTGGLHGGLWEFPGGKQEPGESLEACLAREIDEELNLPIEVGRKLASVDQAYPGFSITLHLFACTVAAGAEPPPNGHLIRWVLGSDLHRFTMPEADRRAVEQLADELA
jgi:mutator protein MutT